MTDTLSTYNKRHHLSSISPHHSPRLARLTMWSLVVIGVMLITSGCGAARQTYLVPSYQAQERTQVVRLEVVTASADIDQETSPSQAILEMWALMAQRYLNDHRDFLVVNRRVATTVKELTQVSCADKTQGRLVLTGQARPDDDQAHIRLWARLVRCPDQESGRDVKSQDQRGERLGLIWSADVDHTSSSQDEVLVTLRQRYTKRFGAVVEDYAAPSFLALKNLLELAPKPKLTLEEDVIEKIELVD